MVVAIKTDISVTALVGEDKVRLSTFIKCLESWKTNAFGLHVRLPKTQSWSPAQAPGTLLLTLGPCERPSPFASPSHTFQKARTLSPPPAGTPGVSYSCTSVSGWENQNPKERARRRPWA